MTAVAGEDALRRWLTDYLVDVVGADPEDLDLDAPVRDLGLGSTDAVVLSGELSELLGRTVSPAELFENPTVNGLASALSSPPAPDGVGHVRLAQHASADEAVAIVGLGCRFPGGADGPDAYWDLLTSGRVAVGEVPDGRWEPFVADTPESAGALAATTRHGAFLDDIAGFDAEHFDVSPSEAARMDPQQRLLLEVVHEALEHAGIVPGSLRHSRTGVYAGACATEYGYLVASELSRVDGWSGTGAAGSVIANRVSYTFDLRGPSVTVDTACSSSLVAVHMAVRSLRSGETDLALAGGVNLLLSPAVTRSFDALGAMSPTGRCHAFDAAADGYVRGEGAGVVVLKRLSDAVRDGDRVLAVIRGSAVNQDGRSNGLLAPNPAAQMAVLRDAYADAGIAPRDVDLVEAHGTGTLLGDPIEARALGTVLGRGRRAEAPLLLSAVKTQLGHLEAAAGIAGLIKAVLAIRSGEIPANPGFSQPNPHIPFAEHRLRVVAEPTPWPESGRARRAGVSAFGFGGTNAHVVLEQAPTVGPTARHESNEGPARLAVTGASRARVAATAARLADWLANADATPADVALELATRRSRGRYAGSVVARDVAGAVAGLRALAAGTSAPGVVAPLDPVD
ncbi:beta-ketoacyl synthase N-terminal-like domain-containing protein, partial [Tsukamurella sp. 8J]